MARIIFEDPMQTSDLISIASFFGALLSALYARHAVGEARRANEIAVHNEKLRIYRDVLEIHGLLTTKGVTIKERDLFSHYECIQLAEFYFSPAIYEKLKLAFDTACEIANLSDSLEATVDKEVKASSIENLLARWRKTREDFTIVENEMKNHLRLVKA